MNNQIPIYSISKLDLANECLYAYFLKYLRHKEGQDNIYNLTGEVLHDTIEKLCKGIPVNANEELDAILEKCQILEINFINDNVKTKWINNIKHFIENFSIPQHKRMLNEVAFLIMINGILVRGKIDHIGENDDDTYDLLDWKSSSKFSGEDLKKKGRQLVLYKLAWEFITGKKVSRVGWHMMKYLYVCSKLKNGEIKKKMCERAYWIKECSNNLSTDLKKLKFDEIDIEVLIEEAIQNNSIDGMPQEIKDKYWTEPCEIWYDVTDELVEECKEYITNTVNRIENLDTNNIEVWIPREINNKTAFYCQELSEFRSSCSYLKTYQDSISDLVENLSEHDDILD